jgi:ATP-dependent Clp protease protease subunit
MTHQPSGGARGQATDIEIHAKEILHVREMLNAIFAANTGQDIEVINSVMERDRFMSAEESKKFGIIDDVIDKRQTC